MCGAVLLRCGFNVVRVEDAVGRVVYRFFAELSLRVVLVDVRTDGEQFLSTPLSVFATGDVDAFRGAVSVLVVAVNVAELLIALKVHFSPVIDIHLFRCHHAGVALRLIQLFKFFLQALAMRLSAKAKTLGIGRLGAGCQQRQGG